MAIPLLKKKEGSGLLKHYKSIGVECDYASNDINKIAMATEFTMVKKNS